MCIEARFRCFLETLKSILLRIFQNVITCNICFDALRHVLTEIMDFSKMLVRMSLHSVETSPYLSLPFVHMFRYCNCNGTAENCIAKKFTISYTI